MSYKPYFWGNTFNPPIPTVFDESLSYEEQIRRLYLLVDSAINYVMNSKEEFIKEAVKKSIAAINERLTAFENSVNSTLQIMRADLDANNEKIAILEQLIKTSVADINSRLSSMQSDIATVKTDIISIQNQWLQFKQFIESRYNQLESQLKEEIKNAISSQNGDAILVTNPVTGKRDTLKRTLEMMWSQRTAYGITAGELNNLNITAGEWDALHITGEALDNRGALILYAWKGSKN